MTFEMCIETLEFIKSFDDFGEPDLSKWPAHIPHPPNKPPDVDGMISFDFSCMSGACTFLHELNHIKMTEDNASMSPHEEGFLCDKFARDFLTGDISTYAANYGFPVDKVTAKRWIAIVSSSLIASSCT